MLRSATTPTCSATPRRHKPFLPSVIIFKASLACKAPFCFLNTVMDSHHQNRKTQHIYPPGILKTSKTRKQHTDNQGSKRTGDRSSNQSAQEPQRTATR